MKSTNSPFKFQLLKEIDLETFYQDGKRYYKTPEGNNYRSVTTALSLLNADKIKQWREKVGEEQATKISTSSSSRGTKFHKLCEDFLLGNKVDFKDAIQFRNMFNPVKDYLLKYMDLVYGIESALYSDKLKLAGRCDLICRLHGMPCIVDFKTSSKPKKEEWITNYFYQCSAYAQMVAERHDLLCKWICVIIAVDDPNEPFQVFYRPVNKYYKPLVEFLNENPDTIDKKCFINN